MKTKKLSTQSVAECPECPTEDGTGIQICDEVGLESWIVCEVHLTCWPDLSGRPFWPLTPEQRCSFVYDLKKVEAERRRFFKKYRVVAPRVVDFAVAGAVKEAARLVTEGR
jgi:hypothetical protein